MTSEPWTEADDALLRAYCASLTPIDMSDVIARYESEEVRLLNFIGSQAERLVEAERQRDRARKEAKRAVNIASAVVVAVLIGLAIWAVAR
jgi:hypothetical protein